jgi:fructose-1,6-bisphosphatase class II
MRGTIVIGEGERDEAPMLYIGEHVGAEFPGGHQVPEVDIAVDPLEGTNLCATGAPGSITVLAASERGGLLYAPDCYMEKIVVGPSCKNCVELDAPVADNLKNIAKRLERDVEDLVVMVLDRPRHEKLIADIRKAGARIKLIGDGDLSAGIAAAVIGTGVHAVMGIGGAPEGVITAAAIRCLNGYMQGRLVIDKPALEERIAKMGIKDKNRIYEAQDLAPGKQMIFAATGVTEGALMRGVRFFGEGTRTSSVTMTLKTGRVRFIESIHLEKKPDVKVRFA